MLATAVAPGLDGIMRLCYSHRHCWQPGDMFKKLF
jgi:hypothetical protein